MAGLEMVRERCNGWLLTTGELQCKIHQKLVVSPLVVIQGCLMARQSLNGATVQLWNLGSLRMARSVHAGLVRAINVDGRSPR